MTIIQTTMQKISASKFKNSALPCWEGDLSQDLDYARGSIMNHHSRHSR